MRMRLFSLELFGRGNKHALIFDIASSSVGVALITHHHKRSTSPIILGTARNSINFKDGTSSSALAEALSAAISTTIEDGRKLLSESSLYKKDNFDIHTIVHAPWADTTAESAEKKFNKPIKITREVIRRFITDSFPNIHSENQSVVSANITQIKLNGYPVEEPDGSQAQSMQLSILLGTMHPDINNTITNSINSSFNVKNPNLTTFTYATYKLAQELGSKKSEYLIADIGGEYSHLTIIKDGQLSTKAALDFGTNYILRAIADKFDISVTVAQSKLKLHKENACTPAEHKNIREALKEITNDWAQSFGSSCSELSKISGIPDSIFLSSDSLVYNWFKESMEKIDFSQFTSTSKPFNVQPVISDDQSDTFYANRHVTKDQRLLLASLFVDKYDFEGTYEKLFMV